MARTLSNRAYIGEFTFGGTTMPGAGPALIDQEVFDKVQTIIAQNARHPAAERANDVEYLLSGKVYCGLCGAPMTGARGRSKSGTLYFYYECTNKKRRHSCTKKA